MLSITAMLITVAVIDRGTPSRILPVGSDDDAPNVQNVSNRIWGLLDGLRIVENQARLVSGTKTLHHMLPDLIVPMDRPTRRLSSAGRILNSSTASANASTRRLRPSFGFLDW